MYRSPFTGTPRRVGSAYLQQGTMWISGHHTGEDWFCDSSKTLVAPASGTVQRNQWDKSYGNYLVIATDDQKVILMAHMEAKALPAEGSRVEAGAQVGIVGSTGNSTGPHLHIEVENAAVWAYNTNLLEPSAYIDFNNFATVPAPSGGYQIGNHVVFSTCYRSSDAPVDQAIQAKDMQRDHGVITRIAQGTRNPYLLDEDLCWVNDGDIRGFYGGSRTGSVSTQAKDLNIRSGASIDAAILGSMPKGAQVTILGESGDWYQIRYNNLTGYASKQYIS